MDYVGFLYALGNQIPERPSNRDHKALNSGTLGGLGMYFRLGVYTSDLSLVDLWFDDIDPA